MNLTPQISIIVPVYKVENYIVRCLDSILNQTFKDWECILVDDGSPDNAGFICDRYAIKNDRFKVLHVKNGGVSKARNIGMDHANGKFITFIDSDDYIDAFFIEALYEPCKHDREIDFVHSGCVNYYENGQITPNQKYENFVGYDKIKIFKEFRGLVFSKLFCLEKIRVHNVRFDEKMKYAEDMVFTIDYLIHSNKYALIDNIGYFYVQRSDSVMNSSKIIDYEMDVHSFSHRYESVMKYIKMYNIPFEHCTLRYQQTAESLFAALYSLNNMGYKRSERLVYLYKDFLQDYFELKDYAYSSFARILLSVYKYVGYEVGDTVMHIVCAILQIKNTIKNKLKYICFFTYWGN